MGSLHRIAVLCGLTAVLATSVAQAEDWKVAKNEDGIKVSLSEVPGSDYKSYQGVALMKTTVAKLRALQEDVSGACAWIHECKTQKLLKHEGDQSWTYTQFNTPWPVTPRDSVLHITTVEGADGSLTRNLEGLPKYIPEEKGFVRVAQVKGFWKFVPKGDQVEVTYQVHTEPGGSVPSMIANKFVVDAPFNTLKALKERDENYYVLPLGTTLYHDKSFPEGHDRYVVYLNHKGAIAHEEVPMKPEYGGSFIDPLWLANVNEETLKEIFKRFPLSKADVAAAIKANEITKDDLADIIRSMPD